MMEYLNCVQLNIGMQWIIYISPLTGFRVVRLQSCRMDGKALVVLVLIKKYEESIKF